MGGIYKYFHLFVVFFALLVIVTKSEKTFNKSKIKNNKLYNNTKRRLDDPSEELGSFEQLNYFFDYTNFDIEFPNEWNNQGTLVKNAIEKAGEILESFLHIFKSVDQPILSVNELEKYIQNFDERFDIGTIFSEFNLVVFFDFKHTGNNPAKTDLILTNMFGTPLFAIIHFNKEYLKTRLTFDYLEALMLHELTHTLGFHENTFNEELTFDGYLYQKEINSITHSYIKSPKVLEFAKKYFKCDGLEGVEIETIKDEEGDDIYGSHWSSRILLGEYMADFIYPEEQVISGFTLAFFEDTGYLKVNKKYTGGLMRFGKNKGCGFVNNKCIGDEEYGNEFYYPVNFDLDYKEPSCSSGRQSRTVYKLTEYSTDIIPPDYQYFTGNTNYGGFPSANYCPVSQYENSETIFESRCSLKGTPSNIASIIGEELSDTSFCALSTLIKKNVVNYSSYTNTVRAVCFKMSCSEKSLTIQFGEDYFVCPREGGKITGDGNNFDGYILCPDYNLICTGTEMCNDMIDCINKQSEENEDSYNYDYTEIKTTQNSLIYSEPSYINEGYELSNINNICPIYCSQCDKNKDCVKCGSNYLLKDKNCVEKIANCVKYISDEKCEECKESYVLVKENENKIICLLNSNLGSQYTPVTESGTTIYVKCSELIPNCFSCTSSSSCTLCLNNFGLSSDGNCVDLSTKRYYYDNEANVYKLCDNKLEGCEICSKTSDNQLKCITCKSNYILAYGDPDQCYLSTTIENNDYLFKNNQGKYFSCSDSKYHSVEKCLKCKNQDLCDLCQNDYFLYNSNKLCLSDSDIEENKYYLENTDNKYYLCSDKINGCKKCENGNVCKECYNEYILEENNKCILLALANRYYFDESIKKYKLCSSKIENCEECSSENECNSCKIGYLLNNNICEVDKTDKIDNSSNITSENTYENYKDLAIAGVVLGCIAIVGLIAVVIILLLKVLFKNNAIQINGEEVETETKNDKQNNEIVISTNRRNIHNDIKNND